jgi:hypothetical protein
MRLILLVGAVLLGACTGGDTRGPASAVTIPIATTLATTPTMIPVSTTATTTSTPGTTADLPDRVEPLRSMSPPTPHSMTAGQIG